MALADTALALLDTVRFAATEGRTAMIQPETLLALSQHVFLHGMRRELLEKLAACTQWVTVTAGQYLGREQEPADAFYLILSGRVAIEIKKRDRRGVRLQTLGSDEIVGWSWLIPPHRWQFDALVIDPVQALALDAGKLRQLCKEDAELGYQLVQRLLAVVASRLAATRQELMQYL
jgi:CRP-like cAMP-binding protein